MKNLIVVALVAALLLPLVGCNGTSKGYVKVESLERVLTPYMERHDRYLQHDPALDFLKAAWPDHPDLSRMDEEERTRANKVYLRSTEVLRKLLKDANPDPGSPM